MPVVYLLMDLINLVWFFLFAFWFWFLVFVVVFCFSFCFFPWDPCSPGSPGTHSADHAGLELRDSPASASTSVEIKSVCYPHPAINLVLINVCCICCGIVVGLLLFCVVCFACLVGFCLFVCLFLCFWDRVSLHSPGCPGVLCIDQTDFGLTEIFCPCPKC